MYITIKKLIDGWDATSYCFDRETYDFVDISMLDSENDNMYYRRYIRLPQFDYSDCEDNYVNQLNDKILYSKYKRNTKGFSYFVEANGLFKDWYHYRFDCFYKNIVQWCKENDIVYVEN